jgi:hypothetical protein
MTRNTQRIPAILTQAWVAAACFGLAGASFGHGFEIGEVAVATGYRQDSSSFSICSGLASPDYFGFGKMRARDMHIWEIGIGASASLTDNAYLRAALSYGVILGGKVQDSGVADINSNPLNSVLGEYYTACCAPCNCDDTPCGCDCEDRIFRKSVQTSAYLNGNVVDFNVALGYAFRPMDDFMIAPVVGWTYNSQRQRWNGAIYGPLQAVGGVEPCAEAVTVVGTPYDYNSFTDPAFADLNPNILVDFFQGCVSFGNCFDGTVYRARWNGPFIGVDLGYAISDVWNVAVGYAFSYNNYNGKFVTLGGCEGDACDCDLCPTFYNGRGGLISDIALGQPYAFQPSEMRFSSWGIGQEVSVATDYRCGNWTAGLGVGYSYKQANHCADSEPCEAFRSTVNPNQIETTSSKTYPIWSYASLNKARWSSFSVLVTLGYQF